MKIGDAWGHFYDHSGKASDVARQLALAGIAAVWLFTDRKQNGAIVLPPALLLPTALLVLSLALDLIQYIVLAAAWGSFSRYAETRPGFKSDDDLEGAPRWLNWPGYVFFALKLLTVICAYALLLIHFGNRISP